MRAQEYVARQRLQGLKRSLIVVRDLGILRVVYEFVSRVYVRTADDYHVIGFSLVCDFQGPGRASLGVPWRKMRRQHDVAETDFVAVVQAAIDSRGVEKILGRIAVAEIAAAAILDLGDGRLHAPISRAGRLFDECAAGAVVKVRVADQK